MDFETTTVADFLKNSLAEKIKKNPRFSLRALAKKAGLSPSHLSRAMNGRTKVSPAVAYKIAVGLSLSQQETQDFIHLANFEMLDSRAKENILSRDATFLKRFTLKLDVFEMISEWYHFAIYELIKAQPKKSEAVWIARRLGLTVPNTKLAIQKLVDSKVIRQSSLGHYEAISDTGIYTENDIPSLAIKNYHRQVLKKAIEAIEQPVNEREFQSLQLAFDRTQLAKAQQKIRKFVESFGNEFASKKAMDIYQMNFQLFPLTKDP